MLSAQRSGFYKMTIFTFHIREAGLTFIIHTTSVRYMTPQLHAVPSLFSVGSILSFIIRILKNDNLWISHPGSTSSQIHTGTRCRKTHAFMQFLILTLLALSHPGVSSFSIIKIYLRLSPFLMHWHWYHLTLQHMIQVDIQPIYGLITTDDTDSMVATYLISDNIHSTLWGDF